LGGGPGFEKWLPVTLVNIGDSAFLDTQESPITMLTIQVFTGELSIVLSDQRGQALPPIPYFDLGVIGVPVHIPLGTATRQITVFAVQANTTASVYAHSPAH
jgi:hypothetical protein